MTTTEITMLTPYEVEPNPENIRQARGIAELAKSIAEAGRVLVPLIVTPIAGPDPLGAACQTCEAAVGQTCHRVYEDPDDFPAGIHEGRGPAPRYVAVDGTRRVLAARSLTEEPPLPCMIVPDLDKARDYVQIMAVTVLARDGLTPKEIATTVQQMLTLGISQASISRSTGLAPKQVKAAKLAAKAIDVIDGYDLTFDQMAAIGEFSEDPARVKILTDAAQRSEGDFEHALARIRREVKSDVVKLKAETAWLTDGYVILDADAKPVRRPDGEHAIRIDALTDEDGGDRPAIDHDAHAQCPGRAVWIDLNYRDDVITVEACCRISTETGLAELHHPRFPEQGPIAGGNQAATDAKIKAIEEEAKRVRREVLTNNKAMLAAGDFRHAYVTRMAGTKGKHKEISAWALTTVIGKDRAYAKWIGSWRDNEKLEAELAGGKAITDPVRLWVQICTAYESDWPKDCWRNGGALAAQRAVYLRHLVTLGYTLSDVEQIIIGLADEHVRQITEYSFKHGAWDDEGDQAVEIPSEVTVELPDEDADDEGNGWARSSGD